MNLAETIKSLYKDKFNLKENNIVLSKVNSLMIAILLTSNFIAMMIASLGIIENGVLPVLFVGVIITSYSLFFLMKNKKAHIKNIFQIDLSSMLLLFIIIFFIISIFYRGTNSYAVEYFINFIAYGIIPFLLTRLPYNGYLIIKYTMNISIIFLINPNKFIDYVSLNTAIERIGMGESYAILPGVASAIIYLFLYKDNIKNKLNFVNIIGYFVNGYLLILLITKGTRGAVLSIIILIFFLLYIILSKKMNKLINGKIKYLNIIILSVLIILLTLCIIYLKNILIWLYDTLQTVGIELAVVLKSYNLLQEQGIIGILNGRDVVYNNAIEMISKNPIIGSGAGSYADLYNGAYPHNLLLHLYVEGGIILTTPFIIILLFILVFLAAPWYEDKQLNEKRLLILMLFIISIPRLMLSTYLWEIQAYWILIYSFLSLNLKQILINNQKPTL